MSQVFLIIRDEGDHSDREWTVEAVSSTMERALAHACNLAASEFMATELPWQRFYHPYAIQIWTIDGPRAAGETEVTHAHIRLHHPELEPVILRREQEEEARIKLQDEARVRAMKFQERQALDNQLRARVLTPKQYYEAVDALDAKYVSK